MCPTRCSYCMRLASESGSSSPRYAQAVVAGARLNPSVLAPGLSQRQQPRRIRQQKGASELWGRSVVWPQSGTKEWFLLGLCVRGVLFQPLPQLQASLASGSHARVLIHVAVSLVVTSRPLQHVCLLCRSCLMMTQSRWGTATPTTSF